MLSQLDKQFLKKEFRILPSDIEKWSKQQFFRLLALLKLPESIQKQFYELSIDKNNNWNFNDVIQNIEGCINQHNYFPFHKVKSALSIISNISEEDSVNLSLINKNVSQNQQELNISQEVVLALVEEIQKIPDLLIMEMTSQQLYTITKNIGLQSEAQLIKKCNIDGFNIICSLSDLQILKGIRNYFKGEQIQEIMKIQYLFMTQYFRQSIKQEKRRKTSLSKKNITQFQQNQNRKNGLREYIIQSYQMQKKNSQDQIQIDPTEFQSSSYGQSALGTSQMGQSQYATSERGSFYAQSQYANSVRGSINCRISFRVGNDGRASMMYNSQIITQLKQSCLNLPFDLLNLQPLQQIRLKLLKSPFSTEPDKDCWMFSVQGARLGREKQNDIRFPDQQSISSKHAQILFVNQNFYLLDTGSKTGTFLRIQKSIVVEDQTCIQFSADVQILFRIHKKAPNEGVIKAQIKKPDNLPDYKISLRNHHKIKIGRSQRCHIRINSPSMSEKHAQIYYRDSVFYFKIAHASTVCWLRLSPKSTRSQMFKLSTGDIFRLSSKKSFLVQDIINELSKNNIEENKNKQNKQN